MVFIRPRKPKPRKSPRSKSTRAFGNPGGYTPFPGRGPYPWKSAKPNADYGDLSGDGWESASGDSEHVDSMRLVYTEDEDAPGTSIVMKAEYLQVRWRSGNATVYWIDSDHTSDELKLIYGLMLNADHPGVYTWMHLINDQWPYDDC